MSETCLNKNLPLIPNLITLIRLLACPFLVLFFVNEKYLAVLILYTVMEFLDQLDGKLAHAFHWETTTGKFFDPFVDSMTHLTAFACLLSIQLVPLWMYLIFLFREIGLLFVRLLASLQGTVLGGHMAGKFKALIHAVVLFTCFWQLSFGNPLIFERTVWLGLALAASVLSGFFYLYKYRAVLRGAFIHE